jgi:hypothetical protein
MRLAETMIRAGTQLEAFLTAIAYGGGEWQERRNVELHAGCHKSACLTHKPESALVRRLIESLSLTPGHPTFRPRGVGANKSGRSRWK